LQRFISEDPLRFLAGDPNFYAYVANSPVMFTDPSGEVAPLVAAAVACGAGATGGIVVVLSGRKPTLGEAAASAAIGCSVGLSVLVGVAATSAVISGGPVGQLLVGEGGFAALGAGGRETLAAALGSPAAAELVRQALRGTVALDRLPPAVRTQAAGFYRRVAEGTTGAYAEAARAYNVLRAQYLEGAAERVPATINKFMEAIGKSMETVVGRR
jgi:hypothetical protein